MVGDALFKIVWEHFAQPALFNLRGQREEHLGFPAAAFDLRDLGCDDQTAVLRDAGASQLSAAAVNDIADQRASTATAGNLVGEPCEHTSCDRLVAGGLGFRFEAFIACDLKKLLEKLFHLSGSVGMDGERSERIDAKLVTLGIRECPDENEKVGDSLTEDFCTLLLDTSLSSQQEIARLRQGRR